MAPNMAIAALAAVLPFAFGAPAAEAQPAGFSIAQLNTGHKYLSGPLAVEATYLKYGKPVPQNIAAAAARAATQQGSVSANPQQYDSSYLSPVLVGTPGVTLMLDFDTGSADFWVFSSQLPANSRSGHSIYTPGSSSTSRQFQGETWNISYGDGSGARGNVFYDRVVIGGVTATSQAVEAATSVSSQFAQDTNNDGLNGLAFDSINTGSPTRLQTWFGNVAPSLPSPIFAAYLRKGQPGAYDFGYVNSSRYTGSLTYVNVNSGRGFWEFTASGYSVGSTRYSSSLDSIADTGTTLIYLPTAVCNNYYSKVSGAQNNANAGGYIFPCSSTLPNFSVTIGGVSKTVPGSYLNYAPYGSGYCFGGLQSSSGIGINILGDIFLKAMYVVFDTSVPRIGFAQQR